MLRITPLDNAGDHRGFAFALGGRIQEWLGDVKDAHFATIDPGCVRGNHFHALRKEFLLIFSAQHWTFAWEESAGGATQQRRFEAPGAVLFEIDAGHAHAIRNDGQEPLFLVSLMDGPFDASQPDIHRRVLLDASAPGVTPAR
jgi:dTDP-4-dehydrorhamnose 3,5-epimerase-like enzyme